jgi:signal transduction histidine kinase
MYRILAVDDDVLALNLIERVFAGDPDIRTLVTTSPKRALELAGGNPIDLVIADQRMEEMTGLAMLARLRDRHPETIRILLTAYPDVQSALQAINEGLVYRFMLKPWNVDEMRLSIRRALEMRQVQRENERLSLELRRQFDELVQAERMATLGRLSAGLGHELANAVTPLLGHLQLVDKKLADLVARGQAPRRGEPTFEKIEQSLQAMRLAGKQVSAIVSGLKGYAHRTLQPAPWSANLGVETAVQLLAHRFTRQVKVERELGAVPDIECRGEEIVQVLVNLIGNAVDEVEQVGGGRVRVRTAAAGDQVLITVADTGRGLPKRVRDNLFAPFISSKPAGRGTGLGLSICKSIVDAHGGTISVETAPDHGTVFTIALPRVSPPETDSPPEERVATE